MARTHHYTITLTVNTEAENPHDAARYFAEFVMDGDFIVSVVEDDTDKKVEVDVTDILE